MFFNRDGQKPESVNPALTAKNVQRYNVVAVGRAYTDIIANVSTDFLHEHEIPIDNQRLCSLSELKEIQRFLSQTQMVAGGASANTLAIISELGGRTGFFGKVYADTAGEKFLEDLKQRKIDLLMCSPYAQKPEMSPT